MLIFYLKISNAATTINKPVVEIPMQNREGNNFLQVNYDFMIDRYGFAISGYDLDCFLTHYNAWTAFSKSGEEYCLLLEDTAGFNLYSEEVIAAMRSLLEEHQDWDIFFPFDRTKNMDGKIPAIGCVLGMHWGSDAYFISRKGVDKLLKINEIKQPVDEEILWRMLNDELEVCYSDTGFFNFSANHLKEESRKSAIKNAIFNSDAWSIESKEKVTTLIREISDLAQKSGVDLVLSDGSLLGYIRHGGIMPWDDDVDFAIEQDAFDYFTSYIEEHSHLKTKKSYWGLIEDATYLKIWDENGKDIAGHSHKFPFIDIWPYYQKDGKIIFPHGKKYPVDIFYPFSSIEFEGSNFKLPSRSLEYLDVLYPDWRTNIQVFLWRHQEEQAGNMPLNLKITVDENGRMSPAI